MARLVAAALLAVLFGAPLMARNAGAEELPSFMQSGDAFCTNEADFDDLVRRGAIRANSAIETCQTVIKPTRVAILRGRGGVKSMIRVMNGPYAFVVGWTNGKLPLVK